MTPRLGPILLLSAVVLAGYFLFGRERTSVPPPLLAIAGFDDIDECGSVTSFDGSKTLDFERDHKATLTVRPFGSANKPEQTIDGTWSFNEEQMRYTTIFRDGWTVVKPEGSDVCILARGDIGAVNMRESWFGHIETEPPDSDPGDRP